jgi:hypothetical protein
VEHNCSCMRMPRELELPHPAPAVPHVLANDTIFQFVNITEPNLQHSVIDPPSTRFWFANGRRRAVIDLAAQATVH